MIELYFLEIEAGEALLMHMKGIAMFWIDPLQLIWPVYL